MATREESSAPEASAAAPTIHEAELASGPSGAVLYGAEIDVAAAVTRRQAGENVVVRGGNVDANRRLAQRIESAVGACVRGLPHVRHAGSQALPHFQQQARDPPPPGGHSFYETDRRRARRKP